MLAFCQNLAFRVECPAIHFEIFGVAEHGHIAPDKVREGEVVGGIDRSRKKKNSLGGICQTQVKQQLKYEVEQQ